jgi:large subunit ribosomal protein L18
MNKLDSQKRRYTKRRLRVKNSIKPKDVERKRLCITRSNRSMYAQIIDDLENKTVFGVSTLSKDVEGKSVLNINTAKELGKVIAEKAKEKGITKLYFDRNGFLYHGKVKAFADAVRENGIDM